MPKPCSYKVCSKEDCKDFLTCDDIWGGLNKNPHPCAGCEAFNHAEKCGAKRHVDCKINRS